MALVGAACAGCSQDATGGVPTPAPATSKEPTPDAAPLSQSSSSERARSLDLDGKDPCTVMSDRELAGLGSSPAKLGAQQLSSSLLACSYRDVNSPYGTSLSFDVAEGYEQYGERNEGVVVTPVDVAGFRASAVQKPSRAACTVGVDTADSQSLATTTVGSFDAPVPPLCEKAAEFAAAAITALISK
ncbi:DUF3558 domain-containing protein [Rhodococcus aerolatus]